MDMTGAQAMIKALENEGVKTVFGYPGAAVMPFYDALLVSRIRHVLTRCEQGAAHAASGYSRVTGQTGVCIATSGPGATNLITGIATAYMDSIPLIAITGQVALNLIGSDSFQEVDITGATSPFTKHNYLVKSAADLPRIIKEAFYLASTGRPGPVLIDVPVDVQSASIDELQPATINLPGYHLPAGEIETQFGEIATLLQTSKSPMICAGGGIISSQSAGLLRRTAERFGIPVVTTMMGIGSIPYNHPLYLGTLGSHGTFAANYALSQADLVILIGARVGNRAMGAAEEIARRAKIIHVDIDPAEIGKNIRPHVSLVTDARRFLEVLFRLEGIPDYGEWVNSLQTIKKTRCYDTFLNQGSDTIHPPTLMRLMGLAAGPDAIITTEVGQNQIWVANHYPFINPRTFITSGGMGTMGYGLPSALGAKVARPDQTVIAVSGDGSLQMLLQEFGTVKQEKAAIKFVLLNNSRLGMVHEMQSLK